MLLTVFELLSGQLPLFFEATLDLTQLPLCLQQFGLKLEQQSDVMKMMMVSTVGKESVANRPNSVAI